MIEKKLGILGGGQLGRMSAMAAARLGIKAFIFCPEQGCPASDVSAGTYFAEYNNYDALREFAEMVDVITYEFENIPVETVRYLQKFKPVFPDDRLLEVSQDRTIEKKFLNDIGIPTATWKSIQNKNALAEVVEEWDVDRFLLKTARFGYDGKGQRPYKRGEDIDEAWHRLGGVPLIAEQYVDFSCELSIIIARDRLLQTTTYGPMLNEHKDGILSKTTVPANVPEEIAEVAKRQAHLLAEAVDLTGVLTLELFLTKDGRLLANEIAPRTHNSGHWSIDACAVSQFENHVRTVCGLQIGHPGRHSDAVMRNLIGDEVRESRKLMEAEHTCLHLYGKYQIRPGRKMGHVTVLRRKSESQ